MSDGLLTLDRIEALIDRRIASTERLLLAKLDERDKALELQAVEYERRLGILNGEHNTLTSMRGEFVQQIVYNKDQERARTEAAAARQQVEQQRQTNEAAAALNQRNRLVGWMGAGIAIVGWGITVALKYLPGSGH